MAIRLYDVLLTVTITIFLKHFENNFETCDQA